MIAIYYHKNFFLSLTIILTHRETEEKPIKILSFDYEETGYPLEVQTKVQTSDESFDAIWEICERSLRRCMHETYEDCPFYEQLQYAMDARNQILYTYAISMDDRLAKRCMEDFRYSAIQLKKEELLRLKKNENAEKSKIGLTNCSAPNYEKNIIPGFSIFYIGMLYDHMMYFGEKDWVIRHLPTVEGILDYFEQNCTKEGYVGKIGDVNKEGNAWSFIDWTPEWDETDGVPPCTKQGPITMESFLYLMGLQMASKLSFYVNQDNQGKDYEKRAKKLKKAINKYCRGANGMYQDGPEVETYSQHCQVFAVLTNTVTVEKGRNILLETLKNKEKYAQCSIAMMFYLFRALEKCNLYEYTNELWDIWRNMVKKHLTTCEEDQLMSRSDCHAWGALALYELPCVVLGVRPTKPGFAEYEIKPKLGKLEWVKGSVITPKGKIEVEVKV